LIRDIAGVENLSTQKISDDGEITLIGFGSAYLATTVSFSLNRVDDSDFISLPFKEIVER